MSSTKAEEKRWEAISSRETFGVTPVRAEDSVANAGEAEALMLALRQQQLRPPENPELATMERCGDGCRRRWGFGWMSRLVVSRIVPEARRRRRAPMAPMNRCRQGP